MNNASNTTISEVSPVDKNAVELLRPFLDSFLNDPCAHAIAVIGDRLTELEQSLGEVLSQVSASGTEEFVLTVPVVTTDWRVLKIRATITCPDRKSYERQCIIWLFDILQIRCRECEGDGRVTWDGSEPERLLEVISEENRAYLPCTNCRGKGYLTPQDQDDRVAKFVEDMEKSRRTKTWKHSRTWASDLSEGAD